jgi:hypothetical protein
MRGRRPADTPNPTPAHRDTAQAPHAALDVTMATVGIPAWTARHRPPPELSPRRQTRLDPLDQFPEPALLETDRATQPYHASPTPASRPERAERAARFHAPAPRPAPPSTRSRTASTCRRNATLALPRVALARSHRTPFRPHTL